MVKELALKLQRKHRTNNPFDIAEQRNIIVVFEELGSMLGYFSAYRRCRIIHINNWVSDDLKHFTCAHELGHAILHPKINTPFLKENTFFSVNKLEQQANRFAIELLVPDWIVYSYRDLPAAFRMCRVPMELMYLKNLPRN